MKTKVLFILIILLAFLLRTYKLDKYPGLLYGDEQAFAWNAYTILKMGTDEFGTPYPLEFRSFDDYKAPIPVYLLVPFIKFLGFNPFAIRLPIALASIFTVIAVYFFARLYFNQKASFIITFLMAVSAWHIHLSRGFFESTLALLWFILGVYFFVKDKPNTRRTLLSMTFFALSIYSYFTPRLLLPLFLLFLLFFQRSYIFSTGRFLFTNIKIYIIGFLFLFVISLPLLQVTFFGQGLSRMKKLNESTNNLIAETVKHDRFATNLEPEWNRFFHNKLTVWVRLFKDNYLEHLSANFWYIYGDSSLRYFTGNMGMFYLIESPFFIFGLYNLWKEKRRAATLSLGWILLAPIPASLVGRPFALRSLAMLPVPFFIVGFGIYKATQYFKQIFINLILSALISIAFITSLCSLSIRYYLEYPVYAATWWGWENKAAFDFAKVRESNFDNIFISDFYTGSTLAFAVYTGYDPKEYIYSINHPVVLADGRHLIKLGKYYFGSLDIDSKRLQEGVIPPRSLYIGRPEEADSALQIKAPDDGRVIFKIYEVR
ncbi:glycosyltransferase family 39 protein [Candidatus Gottesmanbacteria bacterium]|nr:glycosyltransferase family 39 protein [Candidatus Gottesmanbacteria bacterium]